MKTVIYVPRYSNPPEIISSSDYEKRIKDNSESLLVDEIFFSQWLDHDSGYQPSDIWFLNEVEKGFLKNEYQMHCEDKAREGMEDDWVSYTLEV